MDQERRKPDTDAPTQQEGTHPPHIATEDRFSGRIDRNHPLGGEMSDILGGLLTRVRLPWLLQHHAQLPILALFSFLNGCISIGLMSILAVITRSPFIFPSLGPT